MADLYPATEPFVWGWSLRCRAYAIPGPSPCGSRRHRSPRRGKNVTVVALARRLAGAGRGRWCACDPVDGETARRGCPAAPDVDTERRRCSRSAPYSPSRPIPSLSRKRSRASWWWPASSWQPRCRARASLRRRCRAGGIGTAHPRDRRPDEKTRPYGLPRRGNALAPPLRAEPRHGGTSWRRTRAGE